ncbi:MAG: hypothetical protein ACFFB3_17725, partial [Candidatus Hodarchaeota archaeon]
GENNQGKFIQGNPIRGMTQGSSREGWFDTIMSFLSKMGKRSNQRNFILPKASNRQISIPKVGPMI